MSDHEWCKDVARDEAVRRTEDAAAVPAILHRDLPEIVAELRERVARLEAEKAADWKAACESALAASIQVGNLKARLADVERAYSAECDARAQAQRELSDLNDAIRQRESGEERDSSYAAQCREAAAARERADRMFPPPAANAAREECERLRTERDDALMVLPACCGRLSDAAATVVQERDYARSRVAELEAAPPPRGWLTAEEREAVEETMVDYGSNVGDSDCERIERVLRSLLARSTPPRVRRPPRACTPHRDAEWIDAIRAAGGEVEE